MADLPPIKTRVHSIQSHAVPIGDPGLDSPLLSQYSEPPSLAAEEQLLLLDEDEYEQTHNNTGCTTAQGVFALTNTIVGAGMMALPRVMAELGLVGGIISMAVVYCLAYYSTCAIVRAAELTHSHSYPDMVGLCFGAPGRVLLQLAIVTCNGGMMIVYQNIIASSLADPHAGILPQLLPEAWAGAWWLSQHVVGALVLVLLLIPLCCLRNLARLSSTSAISVAIAYAFGLLLGILGIVASLRNQLPPPVWLPDACVLGHDTVNAVVMMVLTIPVTSLSFVCQMNVLPLKNELKNYTQRRLLNVTNLTLVAALAVYLLVAVSGCLLFGTETQDNILTNITVDALTPIVGQTVASGLVLYIQISYTGVLVLTYPLVNYAVREVLVEVLLQGRRLPPGAFYSFSTLMQVGLFAIAVLVPSIWKVLQVSGATAGMLIAYFFPGLLILRVGPNVNKLRRVAAAYTMLVVGALLAVLTAVKPLLTRE